GSPIPVGICTEAARGRGTGSGVQVPPLWHDGGPFPARGSRGSTPCPPGETATMPLPRHRQPIVAVFGSSTLREADAGWREAESLGAALARRGAATMTGGYGGAMAAVSHGAHDAGGHVIGVTVDLFEARGPVNPWVRERVHTPDLFERLRHLPHTADGFVAGPGGLRPLTHA